MSREQLEARHWLLTRPGWTAGTVSKDDLSTVYFGTEERVVQFAKLLGKGAWNLTPIEEVVVTGVEILRLEHAQKQMSEARANLALAERGKSA